MSFLLYLDPASGFRRLRLARELCLVNNIMELLKQFHGFYG